MKRDLYVHKQISRSLIELLRTNELTDISIGQIVNHGKVGRASFYRHFSSKEDVLASYVTALFDNWLATYRTMSQQNDDLLLQTLFTHLKDHRDFYNLLHKRSLLFVIKKPLKDALSYKSDRSNIEAYLSSFFVGGIYGWIEEWTSRGMQESSEEMTVLLQKYSKTNA